MRNLDNDELVELGRELVKSAQQDGMMLRVLGGVAIQMVCPSIKTHPSLQRQVKDLDFVAPRDQMQQVASFLSSQGLQLSRQAKSEIAFDKQGTEIEVTVPDFREDHRIDLAPRLALASPTLPMADLLMVKLARVRFEEKDIKDSVALLLDHETAEEEAEGKINSAYIARLTASDWGLFRTVYGNTVTLEKVVDKYLEPEEQRRVWRKVETIQGDMDRRPKTLGWMINQILRRPTEVAA